jgi:hypothetical protein
MHCKGGYQGRYAIEVPKAGKYALTARVATFTDGQTLHITPNGAAQPVEATVPFTIGLWQETKPIEITLTQGRNALTVALPQGSRGVTVKDFTLRPL